MKVVAKVLGALAVVAWLAAGIASAGFVVAPFAVVDENLYIAQYKDDIGWLVHPDGEDLFCYPGTGCSEVGHYLETALDPFVASDDIQDGTIVHVLSYSVTNVSPFNIVAFGVGISADAYESAYYGDDGDPIAGTPEGWGATMLTSENFDDVISDTDWAGIFAGETFETLFPDYWAAIGFGIDGGVGGLIPGEHLNAFMFAYNAGPGGSPAVIVAKDPGTGTYYWGKGGTGSPIPLSTVPEPATSGLYLLGLAGIALLRRRR